MIEKQIVEMPAAKYHALPGMSAGGVKHILRSPAHFEHARRNPTPPTPQMQFGTIVHALILEPATLAEVAFTVPDDAPDKRTKDGRAYWEEVERVADGRIVIKAADLARATLISGYVRSTPAAAVFLDDGYIESSVLWQATSGGVAVPCRCRPDFMARDCSVIVDIKTAHDASASAFQRALWNFRYDVSAAWYMEGVAEVTGRMPHSYLFCVVEPDPPHGVAWYRMNPQSLGVARADIERAVDLFAYCSSVDDWPAYTDEIQSIEVPRYAKAAIDPITEG